MIIFMHDISRKKIREKEGYRKSCKMFGLQYLFYLINSYFALMME